MLPSHRRLWSSEVPWLCLGYLWLLVHHAWGFAGHNGFDDMLYARLAQGWNQGEFIASDHFSYRWGLLAPAALAYRWLGLSDWTTALPALLATALTATVVWRQLRPQGRLALVAGLALLLLERWTLAYSDQLMPDAIVTLSVVLAWRAYARHHYGPGRAGPQGLQLALALFLGLLTKGSIVLVLPALLVMASYDALLRRDLRLWGWAAAVGSVLLLLYFGSLYLLTGAVDSRLTAIYANAYQNPCSYHLQPVALLWARVGYAWWLDLLRQGTLLAPLLALVGLRGWRWRSEGDFWRGSTLLLLLCGNFMTVSLDHYQPLCLDVRHYLLLVPVAAIGAAPLLRDWARSRRYGLRLSGGVLAAAALAASQGYPSAYWLYLPLGLVLAGHSLAWRWTAYRRRFWRGGAPQWVLGLALLTLLPWPWQGLQQARSYDFAGRRDAFLQVLPQLDPELPVLTGRVWRNLGPYYEQFAPGRRARYQVFTQVDSLAGPFYLLLDGHGLYQGGISYEDWPFWSQQLPTGTDTLVGENETSLRLYRLPGLPALRHVAHFSWDSAHFTQEFALTDTLGIADWPTDSALLLRLQGEGWQQARGDLQLVATVEDRAGNLLHWYGRRFDQQLKALTTWWPLRVDLPLPAAQLRGGERLRIYVWNPPQRRVRLRHLRLEAYRW